MYLVRVTGNRQINQQRIIVI